MIIWMMFQHSRRVRSSIHFTGSTDLQEKQIEVVSENSLSLLLGLDFYFLLKLKTDEINYYREF